MELKDAAGRACRLSQTHMLAENSKASLMIMENY